jgi:hypothetical protein
VKTITLSDEAAELLLMLLSAHRDDLEAQQRRRFGPESTRWRGRIPTPGDIRDLEELALTQGLIAQLNEI